MDNLQNLLGRYGPKEPDEVAAIKQYITDNFRSASSITVKTDHLVVTVASAALANTLRLASPKIQSACGTTKRLVFRIGL